MRRGYVLVVPTRLAGEPMMDDSGCEADVEWWSRACEMIVAGTRLGVVIIDGPGGGPGARRVRERAVREGYIREGAARGRTKCRGRVRVLEDLSRPERSAVLELSRAVCTGHQGLLAEAGTLGTVALEPWQFQAALRRDAVDEILADPVVGVLPATA